MTHERHRAEVDQIRAAIAHLTQLSKREVIRDDGSRVTAVIASLWEQSSQATSGGSEPAGRAGPLDTRNLIDLNLVAVRGLITRTTKTALHRRGLIPTDHTTPGLLRLLANHVVRVEPDDCWWWAYRFSSWARLLSSYLSQIDHVPRPVRLRNTPCPECKAGWVVLESEDGPVVVPPILIDFHKDGYVRAAQCTACAYIWWRGVQLEQLAAKV